MGSLRHSAWLLVAGLAAAGCAEDASPARTGAGFETIQAALTVTLNTYINQSVEIDQLGAGPGDANLVIGADSDGTASAKLPVGGPSTFVDWTTLGSTAAGLANHRFQDLNSPVTGKDETSFPGSNECVGASQVLSKMDLTYVAAANNDEFSYLGVQRSDNAGDAGYYWLFTLKTPTMTLGEAPCSATHRRLKYDISGPGADGGTGDVLVAGHFHPNTSPLLRIFQAKVSRDGVPATHAIDFTDSTLWVEKPEAIQAVAVNTTPTAPGTFGLAGVKKTAAGGKMAAELFAEAGIDMQIFTGGSKCGATYYACVITRSSGAGGTSPDLKDLSGPTFLNFGRTTATATMSPTCGLAFSYAASGVTAQGTPIVNPSCSWTFSNGTTSNSCSGTLASGAGNITGTVVVTDPATACSDSEATASVLVAPALTVAASATGSCDSTFGYGATVSGGSNPAGTALAWTFSGPGSVTPASSTAASGTVTAGGAGTYTATVTATDPRTDITCTATGSASAVAAPVVQAVDVGLTPTCDFGYGYHASATAGGQPFPGAVCSWTFDGVTTSGTCSGANAAAAGTHTGTVTVTDPTSGCSDTAAAGSVAVHAPIGASAVLTGSCSSTFTYSGAATGGSDPDNAALAWTFSGPGATSPATSAASSGSASVAVPGAAYTGTLVVTDPRTDITCTATASSSAMVYAAVEVAAAALTPTCGLGFGYTAAASSNGALLANPLCEWTFDNGAATSSTCDGSLAAAAGVHVGSVTVTDPISGCSGRFDPASVSVYEPLSVTAGLAATCNSTFTYAAAISGGSNPAGTTVQWTFAGGGTTSPSTSTSNGGTVAIGTPAVAYSGTVVATDPRSDITCTASSSDAATPFAPIVVHLAAAPTLQACPSMTSDQATFNATVTGGDGNYVYAWDGAQCAGTSCTVVPPTGGFCASTSVQVSVSDGSHLCPAALSETGTYTKVTTVTVGVQ